MAESPGSSPTFGPLPFSLAGKNCSQFSKDPRLSLYLSVILDEPEDILVALKSVSKSFIENEKVMFPFLSTGGKDVLIRAYARFSTCGKHSLEMARIVETSVSMSSQQMSMWLDQRTIDRMFRHAAESLRRTEEDEVTDACLRIMVVFWPLQYHHPWRISVVSALGMTELRGAYASFHMLRRLISRILNRNQSDSAAPQIPAVKNLWVAVCLLAAHGFLDKTGCTGESVKTRFTGEVVEFLKRRVLSDREFREAAGPLGMTRVLSIVIALPGLKLLEMDPVCQSFEWLTEKFHAEFTLLFTTGLRSKSAEEASRQLCKEFVHLILVALSDKGGCPLRTCLLSQIDGHVECAADTFLLLALHLRHLYEQDLDLFRLSISLLNLAAYHPDQRFQQKVIDHRNSLLEFAGKTDLDLETRFKSFSMMSYVSLPHPELVSDLGSNPKYVQALLHFIEVADTSDYIACNSFILLDIVEAFCSRAEILSRLLDSDILKYCDHANLLQLLRTRQRPALISIIKRVQRTVFENVMALNNEPVMYDSILKSHLYLRFDYREFTSFPHLFSSHEFCDSTSSLIAEDPRVAADALLLSICPDMCSPCFKYRSRLGLVEKCFKMLESPEHIKNIDQIAAGICYSIWRTETVVPFDEENMLNYGPVGTPMCVYGRRKVGRNDVIVQFDCGSHAKESERRIVRGSRSILRAAAPYFEALLSGRFQEGKRLKNGECIKLIWLEPCLAEVLFHALHGCSLQRCPKIRNLLSCVSVKAARAFLEAADFICCEGLRINLTKYFLYLASKKTTVIKALEVTENTYCEQDILKQIVLSLFCNKKLLTNPKGFLDLANFLTEASHSSPSFVAAVIEEVERKLSSV